jgi:hypothetical protein
MFIEHAKPKDSILAPAERNVCPHLMLPVAKTSVVQTRIESSGSQIQVSSTLTLRKILIDSLSFRPYNSLGCLLLITLPICMRSLKN